MSTVKHLQGPLLVGMIPGQNEAVLDTAISLAQALNADLHFVYVDPTGFSVREEDGPERSASIDPDSDDDDARSSRLESLIGSALAATGIQWRYRLVRGEAAHELACAAEAVGASMIIVGARRQGVIRRMENLLTGSVAAHLAHHQRTPVLVVPAVVSSLRGGH